MFSEKDESLTSKRKNSDPWENEYEYKDEEGDANEHSFKTNKSLDDEDYEDEIEDFDDKNNQQIKKTNMLTYLIEMIKNFFKKIISFFKSLKGRNGSFSEWKRKKGSAGD